MSNVIIDVAVGIGMAIIMGLEMSGKVKGRTNVILMGVLGILGMFFLHH